MNLHSKLSDFSDYPDTRIMLENWLPFLELQAILSFFYVMVWFKYWEVTLVSLTNKFIYVEGNRDTLCIKSFYNANNQRKESRQWKPYCIWQTELLVQSAVLNEVITHRYWRAFICLRTLFWCVIIFFLTR